jgi:hypothetical protein
MRNTFIVFLEVLKPGRFPAFKDSDFPAAFRAGKCFVLGCLPRRRKFT